MKNIFAEIINSVSKKGSDASKGMVKSLIGMAQKSPVKEINNNTALQQAKNAMNGVFPKLQKGAQPIATMKDGSILFSDGTLKQTPIPAKYNDRLNILRENVLAQQNFTPQAEAYLRSIPLNSFNSPGSWGTYWGEQKYPIANKGGGNVLFDESRTKPAHIAINPDVFNAGGPIPASTLSHEYIHALDANVNAPNDASYYPTKGTTGDSYGFYPKLNAESEAMKAQLDEFLNRYPDKNNPQIQDSETFAEHGARDGSRAMLGPAGGGYSKIFKPSSKNINFTPAYPTRDIYSDIVTKLFPKQSE